jgi:hypothetical protein
VFEDAPLGLRQVLVGGWLALGLRLAPRPSPDHVLGWRIASTTPDTIVLELDSKLMSAQNVIEVDGTRVVWTTLVHYRNRLGAVMWSAAAPVHHLILPRLLGRAAA